MNITEEISQDEHIKKYTLEDIYRAISEFNKAKEHLEYIRQQLSEEIEVLQNNRYLLENIISSEEV